MKDGLIEVEHSGYSEKRGFFCDLYYIDAEKTDYEIHFPDGDVYRQISAFHSLCEDWNHDNDRYEQFGAYFEIQSLGRGEFITPVNMVDFITEHGCSIAGIDMKTVMGKKSLLHKKQEQTGKENETAECKSTKRKHEPER